MGGKCQALGADLPELQRTRKRPHEPTGSASSGSAPAPIQGFHQSTSPFFGAPSTPEIEIEPSPLFRSTVGPEAPESPPILQAKAKRKIAPPPED